MKRQKKKYSRPRKPFDKTRIDEENILRERYGLKNKKEIWKADASIRRIRNLAKELITKSEEEKQAFVERLQKKGFQVENLADALALNKEDWLKRRLQTVVHAKKLTTTPKQSRQFITHKHVTINGKFVNIPSYQVSLEEEPNVKLEIELKIQKPKKSKVEEIKEEIEEEKQAEKFEKEIEKEADEEGEVTEKVDKEIKEAEEETKEEIKETEEKEKEIKEKIEDVEEKIEKEQEAK